MDAESPTPSLSGRTSRWPGPGGAPGAAGRPLVDPVRYWQRNVVERAVARLKQHRAIVTGYDNLAASYHKLAASYHTWLVLAALLLWPHEPSNKP